MTCESEFSKRKMLGWLIVFGGGLFLTGLAGIPASSLRASGLQIFDITVLRSVSVGAVFFVLAAIRWSISGRPALRQEHAKPLLAFAVVGVVLTNGGTTLSVATVASYIAIPVIFAVSIATAIIISVFAKSVVDRIDVGVSIVLILLVAMLVVGGEQTLAASTGWALAIPIVTGVAQGVAYHAVAGGKDLDAMTFYSLGFGIGGAIMALTTAAFGLVQFQDIDMGLSAVKSLAAISIGTTFLPYIMIRVAAANCR